jgi:hypothetical protein
MENQLKDGAVPIREPGKTLSPSRPGLSLRKARDATRPLRDAARPLRDAARPLRDAVRSLRDAVRSLLRASIEQNPTKYVGQAHTPNVGQAPRDRLVATPSLEQ